MERLQLHLIGVGGGSTHLAVLRGLAEVPLSAVATRLVEAALVVRLLAKGAGLLFVGSACKLRSAFVPTGLLKDEPDVASPEHKVEKSENLKRRRQNYSAHKCLGIILSTMPKNQNFTVSLNSLTNTYVHNLYTYHRGIEPRPARSVHGVTLVALGFAGGDRELDLIRISGHLHIGQSLGPGRGADQPHEGEHHGHHKVLTTRGREKTRQRGVEIRQRDHITRRMLLLHQEQKL